jgi:RNA polymerase sigma-70 factor (ECF subfamily)
VKAPAPCPQSGVLRVDTVLKPLAAVMDAKALDVGDVLASHGDFLWATLQRFGVRDSDLSDLLQEVLVVVHQRLHTYDPARPLKPWLFGICLRVAVAHRRRAYVRHERPVDAVPEDPRRDDPGGDPEEQAAAREARARLAVLLDELEPERRAVFVMFELEELPCDQIAAVMGVPIGTVYSRLHAARKEFQRALERWRKRAGANGGGR